MKLDFDKQTDVLFVRFADETIVESEEVRPGLVIDFDKHGKIVAIEMLDVHQNLSATAIADIMAA
jgi:uncharacterized protein YuzE